MASTYLSRTPASSGNRKTWTYSAWVKRGNLSSNQNFGINQQDVANNNIMVFTLGTNNKLDIYDYNGAVSAQLITNRVFTDTSAWYHIVVAVDTTNATADDRMKIYVNGVQETSFSSRTNPSLNYDFNLNQSGKLHVIGAYAISSIVNYFDGQMAHVHFIDGTAYDASAFGQTDATSGIWKPKTSPSVTYGTNGFFLKFANSASLGTDSSGNANNFTVNGSGTQTLDTPSNVFATMNPLFARALNVNFSHGNTTGALASEGNQIIPSTLAVSSGKWYLEFKANQQEAGAYMEFGIFPTYHTTVTPNYIGGLSDGYSLFKNGDFYNNNTIVESTGVTYGTSDIIGVALDLDSATKTIKYYKNGTLGTTQNITVTEDVYFAWRGFGSGEALSINFGNGYFGTTAVSTPESDSAGIGKFEYSVPSGYYALCTKNIATYG